MIPIIQIENQLVLLDKYPKILVNNKFKTPIKVQNGFNLQFYTQQNEIILSGVETEFNLPKLSNILSTSNQVYFKQKNIFTTPRSLIFPAVTVFKRQIFICGGLYQQNKTLYPISQLLIYDIDTNNLQIHPSLQHFGSQIIQISSQIYSFGGLAATQLSTTDLNGILSFKSQKNIKFINISHLIYPRTVPINLKLVSRVFFAVAKIKTFFVVIVGGIDNVASVQIVEIVDLLLGRVINTEQICNLSAITCYVVKENQIITGNGIFNLNKSINIIEKHIEKQISPH